MMRSMFSGVSGLRVHQTKMDVIANNISNVNTVGYKSSRVTFNEIFSQTLSSASGANPQTQRGGTNPMQIGLGAGLASIDMLMTSGAAQRTDNPYDIMIQGDGFFVVSDSSGTYYTRAGAFRLDESGNLTMPNGLMVNGWNANPDPLNPGKFLIDKSNVGPIQISGDKVYSPPEKTTYVNYEGNMNAMTDGTDGIRNTIGFYDSLGNKYTVDVQYTYNETNKNWDMQFGNYIYPNGDKENGINVAITSTAGVQQATPDALLGNFVGALTITTLPKPAAGVANPDFAFGAVTDTPMKLSFTDAGYVNGNTAAVGVNPAGTLTGFTLTVDDTANKRLNPLATFSTVNVNLQKLTGFNKTTDALAVTKDGNEPGDLIGVAIGPDGKITGRYSNGRTKTLAQVVLAQFRNAAGLEKQGNNLFVSTTNSGDPNIGDPQSGGTSLLGGVLEMSNVDLAAEFTEMITTQRGFQANSRIITTSDDMLQELVNLKR